MAWVAAGVAALGAGLNIAGGIVSKNSALKNAQAQAAARNAVLADNIAKEQGFYDTNKGTFDTNMAGYAKPAQDALLKTSQDTRSNNNTGNVTHVDPTTMQTSADASPAVKSEIAKRMLATFNQATDRAKAMGRLGGYGDAWQQNELANRQAGRDIGVTNSFAEGRKALLGPEQDMAAAAAYKPPSIWGPILQGAGSIFSAAGGSKIGAGGGGTFTNSLPMQPTDI